MERRRVPAAIRNVSFPVAVLGYDRRAVEKYVARVNRLIAELEATHSPTAAVRNALEQAEEQTHGILQRARETAEAITAGAWQKGDEITARAKAQAADIVVNAGIEADRVKAEADEHVTRAMTQAQEILAESFKEAEERLQRSRDEVAAVQEKAEAWAREFHADTEAVRHERRALLDDVRELAARLATAAGRAAPWLPSGEGAEPRPDALAVAETAPAPEDKRDGAVTAADAPREGITTGRRPDNGAGGEMREAATRPDGSAS
jgi:cell division septum initiation protein DivIVA